VELACSKIHCYI